MLFRSWHLLSEGLKIAEGFNGIDPTATPKTLDLVGVQAAVEGLRGRQYLGIYEVTVLNDEIADLVLHQRPLHELNATVRKFGFRDLLEDGLLKVWQGETSVEEIIRVAGQTGIEND